MKTGGWGVIIPINSYLPVSPSQMVIELDDGKNYRKALYLMVKTMVSCRFSLKPIHWDGSTSPWPLWADRNSCWTHLRSLSGLKIWSWRCVVFLKGNPELGESTSKSKNIHENGVYSVKWMNMVCTHTAVDGWSNGSCWPAWFNGISHKQWWMRYYDF